MTLAIAFELAIKSVVTAGVVVFLLDILRFRSASERSWLAHFGLAAALVLPLAGELLPRWYVAPEMPVADTPVVTASVAPAIVHAASSVPVETMPTLNTEALAGFAYAIPAAILLGVTIIAVLRLFALRRRSTVLIDEPWLAALAHAQRRMGFKNGAALLVSPELVSPVSWGLFRPTILVGESASTGRDDAEAIIAHELAHVARFDWMKLLLARVATALLWFNPFVWMLARRCHQLREEAADDAVLRSDVSGTDYAQLLVSAARHESRGLLLAANGVAPSKASLGDRVRRVLDVSTVRTPARLGWSLACIAVGMALGAPLAALTARSAPVAPIAPVAPSPVRAITATAPQTPAVSHLSAPVAPTAPVPPASVRALPTFPESPVPEDHAVDERPSAYAGLSARELMILGTQGVTPEWIRDMRALGYRDQSFGSMMSMAVQGVTPAYVRELAAAGYPRLSAGQITAMRIHGVNGDFIRRVKNRWGFRPNASELIEMKLTGFDGDARQPPKPPVAPRPPVIANPPNVLN
ncbi:MAG: M56 family metallopeptidase [Pseudomonadota bacterium]